MNIIRTTAFSLTMILACDLAFAQVLKIDDAATAEGIDGTENMPVSKLPDGGNKRVPRKTTPQQILNAGLDAVFGDVEIDNAVITVSLTTAGIITVATATITNGTITTLGTSYFSINGVPLSATQVAILTDSDGDSDIADEQHTHTGLAEIPILTDTDGDIDIADEQHIHEGLGATVFKVFDTSPGVWESDSDTYSATFNHNVWKMGPVTVSNLPFPEIASSYTIDATGVITGLTLSRTAAVTALSDDDDLVRWSYTTADALTFMDDGSGNILMGPDGAILLGDF